MGGTISVMGKSEDIIEWAQLFLELSGALLARRGRQDEVEGRAVVHRPVQPEVDGSVGVSDGGVGSDRVEHVCRGGGVSGTCVVEGMVDEAGAEAGDGEGF